MVAQIRLAFRSRDLSLMQTKIEELIRQEPVNFEGYFWGGFLAIQRRNNHDAVRLLRRAEARDANSYVLKLLAISYYSLGQFRLFTATMEKAMQAKPDDFAPYYYLGRYYVSTDAERISRERPVILTKPLSAIPTIMRRGITWVTAMRSSEN